MEQVHICLNQIVSALVSAMETAGLNYAVLRNYDHYPHFSHDLDLVMAYVDVPRFRTLSGAIAEREGWDFVTECDHWARSPELVHNIHVFRFYKKNPQIMLQVDLFHGFLVWGVPLYDEGALLTGTVQDQKRCFTHIDPAKENLFRILQIHSLLERSDAADKVERYRSAVLAFMRKHGAALRAELRARFGVFGEKSLEALEAGLMSVFATCVTRAKMYYFIRFLGRHPLAGLSALLARAGDYVRLFYMCQCGFVLRVARGDDSAYRKFTDALDILVSSRILPQWSDAEADKRRITWRERKIMERGGIVVKWTRPEETDISISFDDTPTTLSTRLISLLVARHPALFQRSSSDLE